MNSALPPLARFLGSRREDSPCSFTLNFLCHKRETSRLQCHLAGFKKGAAGYKLRILVSSRKKQAILTDSAQQSAAGYNLGHLQDPDSISLLYYYYIFFLLVLILIFFPPVIILKYDRSHY